MKDEGIERQLTAALILLPSSFLLILKTLPRLDSNQDKENQNLLCYRYTTG
jgi:hypothetical protein